MNRFQVDNQLLNALEPVLLGQLTQDPILHLSLIIPSHPLILFFENLHGHIVDGRVVEDYDTAVGTRLDVETAVFTEFIVVAAEIVAYGLDGYIQFIGDTVHGTVG